MRVMTLQGLLRGSADYFAFLNAEWLSGNYYLELPQIKDFFLLSP